MAEKLKRAAVGGGELEYEIRGNGEPVLLIHGSHIAGAFLPFIAEAAVASYRLIRYHRRGFAGSAAHEGAFSIEQQAADALALLRHLGVRRAHVVGHSYGGDIALQFALDAHEVVRSLVLLEPALLMVPSGAALFEAITPAITHYHSGDTAGAVDAFLQVVLGLEWRRHVARTVPAGAEQAERDAKTFFEVELPALQQWGFDANKAAQISQPILHVRGSESGPAFEEVKQLVHAWFPQTEDHFVRGVNHLLQMQDPRSVVEGIANFLARHHL